MCSTYVRALLALAVTSSIQKFVGLVAVNRMRTVSPTGLVSTAGSIADSVLQSASVDARVARTAVSLNHSRCGEGNTPVTISTLPPTGHPRTDNDTARDDPLTAISAPLLHAGPLFLPEGAAHGNAFSTLRSVGTNARNELGQNREVADLL